MKVIKCFSCLFLLVCVLFTGCTSKKSIVGHWESEEYFITFKEDGTCISDEDDFQGEYTYIASKKQLVVNRVEETRKYDCEIEGDKMSISIEGHSIGTFKRVE